MSETKDFIAITEVIEGYFDGLYHADTKKLTEVFHPDSRYINLVEGDYLNIPLNEYFEMVDLRTPPAIKGEKRKEQLFSIEFGGAEMAFVRASMTMMNREYLDFLTLSHDKYGWRIMTKVFTYIQQSKEK